MRLRKTKKKILGGYPINNVVISTTLALFMVSLLGIISLHASKISSIIRDNVQLQIFLEKGLSDSEKKTIYKYLTNQRFIQSKNKNKQIKYISKEQAAEFFIDKTNEDFTKFIENNPLRDLYTIVIDHKYQTRKVLRTIKNKLEKVDGVFEVYYQENLTTYINKNLRKISLILMGFSIILIITVFLMISNTIRLALYSQRFLIRSMQLVGAFPFFIKKPFIKRSAMIGLISGLISTIFILILLHYINLKSSDLARLQNPLEILGVLLFTILLGILIDVVSTYQAINKYLEMSLDDLY